MKTVTISEVEYEILKNAAEKLVKFNDELLDKMILEFAKTSEVSEQELNMLNDIKAAAREVD